MAKYKVFLHGVTVGHEICGATTETESEYLKLFYDGKKSDASEFMQTDIVNGVSYYSYIRKNNFFNIENRPGSYFGITVSLGRNICKDIKTLYVILEEVYKHICVGSIVRENPDGGGIFLVNEINAAKYEGCAIIDSVQIIIERNIDKLIGGNLMTIDGNINTHGTMKFHTSEVNSPLFIEAMLSKTVLISSIFETRSKAYNTLLVKYHTLENECNRYKDETNRLKGNLKSLERSNADLQEVNSRADERYKNKLDTVKRELEATRQKLNHCEKDKSTLEMKMEQATNAIEKIDGPYKQLQRLLTNRFRGAEIGDPVRASMDSHERWSKSERKRRLSLGKCVLLVLLLVTAVSLYFVIKSYGTIGSLKSTVVSLKSTVVSLENTVESQTGYNEGNENVPGETNPSNEVDWKSYRIDLQGYNGTFTKGKRYQLNLKRRDNKPVDDNIQDGTWECTPGIEGVKIVDNCISITDEANEGRDVTIFYSVDNEPKVTRDIKIKYEK